MQVPVYTRFYTHLDVPNLLSYSCCHTRCQSRARTHAPPFTDTYVHQHLLLLWVPNSRCQRWDVSSATRYFKQRYGGKCLLLSARENETVDYFSVWLRCRLNAQFCQGNRAVTHTKNRNTGPVKLEAPVLLFSPAVNCAFSVCAWVF